MSQPVPCGRLTPRWSVLPAQPWALAGMALTAGLDGDSAIVWVGPPLDASGPSRGLALLSEPLAVEKPHEDPLSRLYPPSVSGAGPPQLLPCRPFATMLAAALREAPGAGSLWISAP